MHFRSFFVDVRFHCSSHTSTRWYHPGDIMTSWSLFYLFFLSLFVSVLASYKCVRDYSTHRSSYDRSRCIHAEHRDDFFLLPLPLSLSNKQHRGLKPPTMLIKLINRKHFCRRVGELLCEKYQNYLLGNGKMNCCHAWRHQPVREISSAWTMTWYWESISEND